MSIVRTAIIDLVAALAKHAGTCNCAVCEKAAVSAQLAFYHTRVKTVINYWWMVLPLVCFFAGLILLLRNL